MAKKKLSKTEKFLIAGMDIPRAPIIYQKFVESDKFYNRKKDKQKFKNNRFQD